MITLRSHWICKVWPRCSEGVPKLLIRCLFNQDVTQERDKKIGRAKRELFYCRS